MDELMNQENAAVSVDKKPEPDRYYEKKLWKEFHDLAGGFVRIGYLLKRVRDTRNYETYGYASVNEFAEKIFSLDKTQASRFIRINDRFSENGYSEQLRQEYVGFGHAKLAIMLLLPDSINEELTPDYSKTEILAIKDEVDAEKKVTDLEVMMEEKDEVQQSLDSMLAQVAYQIGKENRELYCTLWESQMEKGEEIRAFIEKMAPSGTQTYSVRIPGTGRMLLIIRETEEDVRLINIRDEHDKRTYSKQELVEAFRSIFEVGSAKESWSSTYGESFPEEEKPEVAPVQPKKETKVTKAKPEKKPEPPKPEPMTLHEIQEDIPAPSPIPEEKPDEESIEPEKKDEVQQLPGQDSIENHPEYMPDVKTEEMIAQDEQKACKPNRNIIRGYKAAVSQNMNHLNRIWIEEEGYKWERMLNLIKEMEWRLEKIIEAESEEK